MKCPQFCNEGCGTNHWFNYDTAYAECLAKHNCVKRFNDTGSYLYCGYFVGCGMHSTISLLFICLHLKTYLPGIEEGYQNMNNVSPIQLVCYFLIY